MYLCRSRTTLNMYYRACALQKGGVAEGTPTAQAQFKGERLEMGASWRLLAAYVLLLSASCTALPAEDPYIDLTRYFAFSASSTCGDPPALFEFPVNSGQLQNCSGDDHAEAFATDGDPTTRWQAANGETPVTLTFSLQQVSEKGAWLATL